MHASSLALGWLLLGRHRRGLAVVMVCWLLWLVLAAVLPVEARNPLLTGGATIVLPLSLLYLCMVFAYGFDGIPLESRDSSFPGRHFILPLRTVALVAWPMLGGSLAVGLTWLAWAGGVLVPNGLPVPVWWPALLLPAGLAWLQALLWTPFGWPFVRLVVVVAGVTVLLTLAITGTVIESGELLLCVLSVALLPPAYLLAYRGVQRGRRGDVPDWGRPLLLREVSAKSESRPFASARTAQGWLEWRSHGWTFLIMLVWLLAMGTLSNVLVLHPIADGLTGGDRIAMLMPFSREASLTWLLFHPLAIYPLFLALAMGMNMGKLGDGVQPSSFLLTRPVSTRDLVAVKMRVAAWTTLTSFGLGLLAAGGWLLLPGAAAIVTGWWRQVLEMYPPVRAWAMVPLAVIALVGMTWLHTCKGFVLGLSGRAWTRWLPGVMVFLLVGGASWGARTLTAPEEWGAVWRVLPWLAALVVVLKLAALAWVLKGVVGRGLWPLLTLACVLGTWLLTAGSLFVLVMWLVPEQSVPVYQLALGVVAVTPLVRILAAPLALNRARHG